MRTFTPLLLSLPLVPLATALVPAVDPPHHKAHGYIGNLSPPPTGDFLTSTYCFCANKAKLPPPHKYLPNYDEGHYYQWEYYNYHYNATFVLTQKCRANHHEEATCVLPEHTGTAADQYSWKNGAEICMQWREGDRLDVMCLDTGDLQYSSLGDEIVFNRQARGLGPMGGQGRVVTAHEEVLAVCETLCPEKVGLPILTTSNKAQCWQERYHDMDDMCDGCA